MLIEEEPVPGDGVPGVEHTAAENRGTFKICRCAPEGRDAVPKAAPPPPVARLPRPRRRRLEPGGAAAARSSPWPEPAHARARSRRRPRRPAPPRAAEKPTDGRRRRSPSPRRPRRRSPPGSCRSATARAGEKADGVARRCVEAGSRCSSSRSAPRGPVPRRGPVRRTTRKRAEALMPRTRRGSGQWQAVHAATPDPPAAGGSATMRSSRGTAGRVIAR